MPMAERPGEVEIGSRLLPLAWGGGLALEGGELLLDHAFERLGPASGSGASATPTTAARTRCWPRSASSRSASCATTAAKPAITEFDLNAWRGRATHRAAPACGAPCAPGRRQRRRRHTDELPPALPTGGSHRSQHDGDLMSVSNVPRPGAPRGAAGAIGAAPAATRAPDGAALHRCAGPRRAAHRAGAAGRGPPGRAGGAPRGARAVRALPDPLPRRRARTQSRRRPRRRRRRGRRFRRRQHAGAARRQRHAGDAACDSSASSAASSRQSSALATAQRCAERQG